MPSLKQLEDQGRALLEDQKKLVLDEKRPWSQKRPEWEKRELDIKAVLEQHATLKAVDDPFDGTHQRGAPTDVRVLKGIQAAIVDSGFEPIPAPHLALSRDDAKSLHEAALDHKSLAISSKATTSSSVPQSLIPQYLTNPVLMRREPTRVLSLIPTYATDRPAVVWYSTAGTTAAAAVAEGGTKPTSTIAYSPNTTSVTKLAHVAEVTDETVEDFPAFYGTLTQDMIDGLLLAENAEVLNATVTGAHNFPGLLNVSGILTRARAAEPYFDVLELAIDDLRVGASFAEPDGMVMHPNTWGFLRRQKDSNGRYYIQPDPTQKADPHVWGVPVVLTTQIAAGTVLVGDFLGSTAAYARQDIKIDTTNKGETQFKNNTTLVRAEERLLVTAPRPSGLIKVTGIA